MGSKVSEEKKRVFLSKLQASGSLDLSSVCDDPDVQIEFSDIIYELERDAKFAQKIEMHKRALGYRILNNLKSYCSGDSSMASAPNAAVVKMMLSLLIPEAVKGGSNEPTTPVDDLTAEEKARFGLPPNK